jgi:hypothetical protein
METKRRGLTRSERPRLPLHGLWRRAGLAHEPTGGVHVAEQSRSDQIQSIAEILAATYSAGALRRILVEHSADSTGHCRGCRYPTTAAPVWPCRLWEIGKETERIMSAGRLV